jgi:hypothetical protein
MSIECKECGIDVEPRKKWGYANLCEECDLPETVNKSMGVIVADGKTDYSVRIVRNPSNDEVAAIKAAGTAHDPRSQLRAINKVSK